MCFPYLNPTYSRVTTRKIESIEEGRIDLEQLEILMMARLGFVGPFNRDGDVGNAAERGQ